jgi:hypothetical protein
MAGLSANHPCQHTAKGGRGEVRGGDQADDGKHSADTPRVVEEHRQIAIAMRWRHEKEKIM